MDARHSDWGLWFAAQAERDTECRTWLPAGQVTDPVDHLRVLWQQSAALRKRAAEVQAASMEARARSRDLRLRRIGYDLRELGNYEVD